MELEGSLLLERSPARRWVAIAAIVLPVVLVVMVATWFIRAYIVPPTITIAVPATVAAAPPQPQPRNQSELSQPPSQPAVVAAAPSALPDRSPEPVAPIPAGVSMPSAAIFATLAIAPPNFDHLPSAMPTTAANDPVEPRAAASSDAAATAETTAAIDTPAAIQDPVPLPRHRPHLSIASIGRPVPLPRPRPTVEDNIAPELPEIGRHAAE